MITIRINCQKFFSKIENHNTTKKMSDIKGKAARLGKKKKKNIMNFFCLKDLNKFLFYYKIFTKIELKTVLEGGSFI